MKKLLIILSSLLIVACKPHNTDVQDWSAVAAKYGPDIKKIPGQSNENLYLIRKEDSSIWLVGTDGYAEIETETEMFGSIKIHILNPFPELKKAQGEGSTDRAD